jgi:hypothetical protein
VEREERGGGRARIQERDEPGRPDNTEAGRNHEGKHRTILEETDPREEAGAASREHIEGRGTLCVEEQSGWVDLHCHIGRKLTFLIGFYANKWNVTQKLFLS